MLTLHISFFMELRIHSFMHNNHFTVSSFKLQRNFKMSCDSPAYFSLICPHNKQQSCFFTTPFSSINWIGINTFIIGVETTILLIRDDFGRIAMLTFSFSCTNQTFNFECLEILLINNKCYMMESYYKRVYTFYFLKHQRIYLLRIFSLVSMNAKRKINMHQSQNTLRCDFLFFCVILSKISRY